LADRSYRLYIRLEVGCSLQIGRLGRFDFPAGHYIYTGSARRNLEARIRRHLASDKQPHWHIDYLLAFGEARVVGVETSPRAECRWNRMTPGTIVAPGFGASDCRNGCGSHLKYLGEERPPHLRPPFRFPTFGG